MSQQRVAVVSGASAGVGRATAIALAAESAAEEQRGAADDECEAGAHGSFDDQVGGFLDPSFLKTLPTAGRTILSATVAAARDRSASWTRGRIEPETNR